MEELAEDDEEEHKDDEDGEKVDGIVVGTLTPEELEKLKEAVDERKKLIGILRGKPWSMMKKLQTLKY